MSLKILYLEDEITIANMISEILSTACTELFVARNGQEGLETYLQKQPDLIISDVEMPIMNGIEMTKKIREIDKDVAIYLNTAYSDEINEELIKELQIDCIIGKPTDLDELLDIVEKHK